MKTTVIRIAFAMILLVTISSFSASAQSGYDFFFDRKYESEKIVSKTKYELGYDGLFEQTYYYAYSYDSLGQLEKQETFKWNKRKSIWEPVCCINHSFDLLTNTMTLEYHTWNKKGMKYNDVSMSAAYRLDTEGTLLHYTMDKGKNKSVEKMTLF